MTTKFERRELKENIKMWLTLSGFKSMQAVKQYDNFRMTQRECNVLSFVLEMKFACVESLYELFYKTPSSKSSRYAYERINLLKQHGFLKAVRVYTQSKNYYLATKKAHNFLQSLDTGRSYVKPSHQIDIRYFEHDKAVLDCRVVRESHHRLKNWISERRLKHEWAKEDLARMYLPDALYTNKRSETVAFELELSPKRPKRYQEKLAQFYKVTQNPQGLFQRAIFVCMRPNVEQTIRSLSLGYPKNLFHVTAYKEFINVRTQ